MPAVFPFRAVRYANADVSALAAPPYDLLDPSPIHISEPTRPY